jgi:hypothetical protein
MGRACSIHKGKRNAYRILVESQKERDQQKEKDVGGRIIIKWILDSMGGVD